MDRRSLITGAIGGAAGAVVARELGSTVGAAADVDRSEFEALAARVAYLEQFHPPMPTAKFSGAVSLPDGFVVPFGEVWDFDPDVSTTVEVGKNVVVAGTLQMRPANPGVVHTLRFVGVNEAAFVGGGMDPIETDVGLWVVGAGVLDLAGSTKTSWARAASTITAGSNAITLAAAPVGWQVGDTIVVTPTASPTASTFATQYDTATITALDGATVTLSTPTAFAHPAVTVGPDMTFGAEVLNLTRNVKIEGTPTGRSHGWVTSSSPQTVDYVELAYLGPRRLTGEQTYYGPVTASILGRYPLHFHMCGDGSVGSSVKGTVVHHSGARAFVPHMSNGVEFDACIAHDVWDEPFWWDQANPIQPSHDIVWRDCVASKVQVSPSFRGHRLAGFVLGSGDRNVCDGCVAVGIQGNSDAAGFIWPEVGATMWELTRPVAHNNNRHGFFVWQNHPVPFTTTDFVAYHNGGSGISQGAYVNCYQYVNGYLFGNKQAAVTLHVMSHPAGADPLRFLGVRCDTAGIAGGLAIALARHTLASTTRALFAGCEFVGQPGAAFAAVSTVASQPTLIDVVDCGSVSASFNAMSHPDSSVRVQHAGTATNYTPAGSAVIATFSTLVPAQPTPFPVTQAA